MATSYTISALDSRLKQYLDVNRDELISKALFTSPTSKMLNIMTGVKGSKALVRLDSSITLQDGSSCTFNAQGSDEFSNRIITTVPVAIHKEFCSKDLLGSWASFDVKMAATRQDEGMPFEQQIIDKNMEVLADTLETKIWQGDTNNGDLFDGFYTMFDADVTGGVIPAANDIAKGSDSIWTRVQKLWIAMDPAMAKGATILMSVSMFKQMLIDLANANNFHIFEEITENQYVISMPGAAGTKIMGITGLEGLDVILGVNFDELYLGCDLESDSEDVEFFFSKDDRVFKFLVEFVIGVQYSIPEHIYLNR